MKTKQKSIFIISIALVAFILGWWLAPGGEDSGHVHGQGETASAGAADTVWTCSMHPQVRQPDPGLCPICAMDLIPLTDDGDDEDAELPRLRVSERSLALMEIQTAPVQRGPAFAERRLPGRITVDETRLQTVAAWFPGRVEKLSVAYTGQTVREGTLLMELYSPDIYAAQEELQQAVRRQAERGDASGERQVESARERLRLLGLREEQVEMLAEATEPLIQIPFYSPLGGTVIERHVTRGSYVERGTPLFTLADLSTVWLELEAFESELPGIALGQDVSVEVSTDPGSAQTGTIAFIDPVVDAVKRSARLRVELDNADGRLKPGMLAVGTVQVSGQTVDGGNPLLIPATAPLFTGPRSIVYVRVPETERPTFEARVVQLGPKLGEVYPVIDGLEAGETVVVHGQFKIDSELQIRGRPSMMSGWGTETEDPETAPADPRDPPKRHDFADTVDSDFGRELRPLLEHSLDFTEALAGDDAGAAEGALQAFHTVLLEIGQHRLSGPAHMAWMDTYEGFHQLSHLLLGEPTLENMRDHLQAFTHAMESLYVNFGAGQLPEVYRLFCPMVNMDEIGTWLQRTERVANPYWGAAMLRCGEAFGRMKEEG